MTGGYIMKEKNIQELAIRMGLISVEDMCQYTIAQLVVKIANKVNELVGEVWRFETDVQEILKTQNENIQYLLGKGLLLEVENVFNGWVQDGTFDTLLNQSALKKVNGRIDETNANLSTREIKNSIFKKKVINQFPLLFPDYQKILEKTGGEYLYPQGFNIDFTTNELFILYSPTGGTNQRWIVVYDLLDGSYKGCFGAGSSGGEGLVIKYENGQRYLYVKTTGTQIGKFLINSLPSNRSILSPISEHDCGLYFNFSNYKNDWIVEQSGASLGASIRRNVISFFDSNFNKKGEITIDVGIGGTWVGSYTDYIPKRQGFALGDNVIYQSTGGYYGAGEIEKPYNYQGIRVLNLDGTLRNEGLLSPTKMIEILNQHGYEASRVEHEGCICNSLGDVYSLCVTRGRFDSNASSGGILIFKEFADENYIDFQPSSVNYIKFNLDKLSNGIYPRSGNGGMYNPLTGEKFDNLEQIVKFMRGTDMKKFAFYSSAVTINDLNSIPIQTGIYVTIENANNHTMFMTYTGDNFKNKKFIIYDKESILTQKEISGFDEIELTLENGMENYWAEYPLKIKKNDNNIVTLNGMVKNIPETRPVVIATLPSGYIPKVANLSFNVALSASTHGGYGIITIGDNGEIRLNYTSSNVDYCCLNGITYLL